MFQKESFKSGISHSFPICIAFFLLFLAVGMLGHAKGMALSKMIVMSAAIFAVPMQSVIINSPDLPFVATAINAFILNFKFALMSAAILPLWQKRKTNAFCLHFICSSTYLVCMSQDKSKDIWSYYMGIAVSSYLTAIVATVIGYILWDLFFEFQLLLNSIAHIVLPIHFICLTIKRKSQKDVIVATISALVLTPFIIPILGARFIVLFWLVLAAIALYIKEKICGKQFLQPA